MTSPEGARGGRWAAVAAVATWLRGGARRGLEVMGDVVCRVVPVVVGDTLVGRTDSGLIVRAGLVGHFVEQHAVASGAVAVLGEAAIGGAVSRRSLGGQFRELLGCGRVALVGEAP